MNEVREADVPNRETGKLQQRGPAKSQGAFLDLQVPLDDMKDDKPRSHKFCLLVQTCSPADSLKAWQGDVVEDGETLGI